MLATGPQSFYGVCDSFCAVTLSCAGVLGADRRLCGAGIPMLSMRVLAT